MTTGSGPQTDDGAHLLGGYPRENSLNALRLLLASAVIVDHAFPVGGFGGDPMLGVVSVGAIAVMSFFALSGFLITESARRHSSSEFFRARLLRIMPAFWLSLVFVALVACPIAWALSDRSWRSFPLVPDVRYVVENLFLVTPARTIGDSLQGLPDQVWNASLWTLPVEFACYVAAWAAVKLGLFRRSWAGLLVTIVVVIAVLAAAVAPSGVVPHAATIVQLGTLGCAFAAGALFRVFGRRVPIRWPLALVSGAVVAAIFAFSTDLVVVASFPLAYLALWIGARVPAPALLRRHDVSYGVYVLGMPVQQVLAAASVTAWGVWPYAGAAMVVTGALATVSWRYVERPALRWKSGRLPIRARRTVTRTVPEVGPEGA